MGNWDYKEMTEDLGQNDTRLWYCKKHSIQLKNFFQLVKNVIGVNP